VSREERMLSFHTNSLTALYDEKLLRTFGKPNLDGDSVTSISETKKIAHITRHLLTGEATHSLRLEGEFYERL